MSRLQRGAVLGVGTGGLALSASFLFSARPALTASVILLGGLWIASLYRGWRRITQTAMLLFVALAATATLLETPLLLNLAALTCALAAWDLERFSSWMLRWGSVSDASLERAHLTRLLTSLGLGLALGIFCWWVQVSISFLWALALASIGVYGLYRASMQWRRDSVE